MRKNMVRNSQKLNMKNINLDNIYKQCYNYYIERR